MTDASDETEREPRQWAVDFVRKLRSQEVPSLGHQNRGRREWDLGIAIALDALLDAFGDDLIEQAAQIADKAFEGRWVWQDCLDAIRALKSKRG
jgi:hypothetical protein